jgi:hydroxymethylbilane synthase
MSAQRRFRIGTRGSPLALAQTNIVRDRLIAAHPNLAEPEALTIEVIRTTGDKVLGQPLAEIGGKGLFTKEIDEAMLDGRIDLAVHSMKDVPTWLPDGIVIGGCLEREDPRDAWIARSPGGLSDLPAGAVVGTASLRRGAQVLHRRPDLKVVPLRGNVGTRLEKVAAGEVDATMLALAGLRRLGRADAATSVLEIDDMLPAVAQGAVGIACRDDDDAARALLAPIADHTTAIEIAAERAMLARLDGSCRTPIAGLARFDPASNAISLRGLVARVDGSQVIAMDDHGAASDAADIGDRLGARLLETAGPGFLAGV